MSSEEIEGLEGLGVSVKNQESLENDIMGMIAQRIKLKEQDVVVKQVKKEFHPLIQSIKQSMRKKRICEKEIKHIHNSSSSITSQQNRRIASLIDDQDSLEKHINELINTQKTLLQRLKDCEYNYDEDPEIKPWKVGETIEEEETNEEPETETELQKNIRLGDVTAFGTTLHTTSSRLEDSKNEFDDYLQQQIQNQGGSLKRKRANSSDSDSGFIDVPLKKTKEESIDKGKVLTKKVQKSKRISRLVNQEADIEIDADNGYVGSNLQPGEKVTVHLNVDPEWQPSGSEEEEKFIKKKKVKRGKKAQIAIDDGEGGWKTDDSDWEGTDDEGAPKKRRGNTDDGDKDLYMSRIASWQANRSEEEKLLDGKFEELDGGLKAPTSLWNKLYNYQKVGVQWMFELHQQKCGGILGDEMGLGKTIQVIAFLASLSYSQITWSGSSWRGLGPTIIVCPTTLLHQWVSEFHKWWPPLRVAVLHTSGSHTGSKTNLIRAINSSGGILIMSYQAIASQSEQISNLKWHYIILDEGHKIRNPDAKVTLAVKQIATPNRLILSGSPMQNNLKELWSLFDFIYPGKLGTLPVFMQQFSGPITQGGYANASSVQVATAFKCATVLKDTIGPYLLRRMKADVKKHIKLPEKNEQVLFCRLTEEQRSLYRAYIDGHETKSILSGHLKVFVGLIALRQICNHADLHSGGPKIENIDPAELEPEDNFGWYKRSGKMIVVHSLLKLWKKQGHRVLLFSQSRKMIAILETYVKEQGYKYLRLDGGTAIGSRQKLITKFNDGDTFVFILTTKVGGLGVNLTGANRVVIFDPDWNPSTDTQARERAWRIGQEKQVTIYRLMTAGTIEEKIYHRQIFKQFLVNRVLKDPKQRRFFKSNDLYELFTLTEATEEDNTETSAIFAGTGSDIKVKPKHNKKEKTPNYSVPVFKPVTKKKKEADGAEKDVKKSLNRLYDEDAHTSESIQTSENTSGSSLTDEMRQRLREQAKRISAKFSENKQKVDNKSAEESSEIINLDSPNLAPKQDSANNPQDFGSRLENSQNISIPITNNISKENSIDTSKPNESDITELTTNSKPCKEDKHREKHHKSHKSHKSHKHKHKKHKHKHSKHKDSKFEGERLPNLVKSKKYKPPIQDAEEQEKTSANQDNYVLAKLFAKSGVHSAVQHDAIIDGGGPDYAIVESEASEIAKQAVMAMKESRRECLRAEAGVPNWTGNNGGLTKAKFGAKKRKPGPNMTSTDLLALMKNRNMLVSTVPKDTEEEIDLFRPDHQGSSTRPKQAKVDQGNLDLLADIRNFIAFQAAVDGEASTSEVVGKFQRSLPSQQSPLFKAFLQQICDFRRNHEGKGIWRLKTDFR